MNSARFLCVGHHVISVGATISSQVVPVGGTGGRMFGGNVRNRPPPEAADEDRSLATSEHVQGAQQLAQDPQRAARGNQTNQD